MLFYYVKNLKYSMFFEILKFVLLSEVASRSFCVEFSGLISEIRILEKPCEYSTYIFISGLFLKLTKSTF